MIPIENFRYCRPAAVSLKYLIHRQPSLHVLLRFSDKNVATSIRAAMVLAPTMFDSARHDLCGIAGLREECGDLADLAELGQAVIVEALSFGRFLGPMVIARLVEPVEAFRIFLGKPRRLGFAGKPSVESRRMTILIEGAPRLMAVVIFLRDRHLVIFREPDAVARQILEQSASTLLEIHFPSFLPRHDFLRKH